MTRLQDLAKSSNRSLSAFLGVAYMTTAITWENENIWGGYYETGLVKETVLFGFIVARHGVYTNMMG